jgi:hypothetical protein
MENMNIGIANLLISNKIRESYFDNNLIEESKKVTLDFLETIKNSPILQLEFKVFNNLENKHIENELAATRYVDNNIKLFEVYTIDEINKEHEKLNNIFDERCLKNMLDKEKINLYSAVHSLIKESISNYNMVDVDKIHESFTIVLNHIKKPKNILSENVENDIINDEIIEIAIDKFNEKYSSLNEDDRNLFQRLIKSKDNEKIELLNEYKTENLLILEKINKDNIKDNITKAISKIHEMKYDNTTIDDDIISLHELKKSLC